MENFLEYTFILLVILFGLIVSIYEWFRFVDTFISKPYGLDIKLLFKGDDMGLVYGFSCDIPVDGDVSERRLSVSVNDKEPVVSVFDATATDLGEFTFTEGDNVVLSLVDVDDVGNVSEPAVVEFVAADTIPPSVPGGFTVSLLREVDDLPDPPDMETT